VSKVCWDNYVAIPKAMAVKLDIAEGDTVNVKVGDVS
jgi:antitoxin component of MazEF toxin-antitoxin module